MRRIAADGGLLFGVVLRSVCRRQHRHLLRTDYLELARPRGIRCDPGNDWGGVVNVVMALVGMSLIDKAGRRMLLIICFPDGGIPHRLR